MDDLEDKEEEDRIIFLWDYFHSVTSELHDKNYTHLELAALMMAYSLKLYRLKLDDQGYQGMLNFIFQQHNRIAKEDGKLPTLH